jgi:hypothetical protein
LLLVFCFSFYQDVSVRKNAANYLYHTDECLVLLSENSQEEISIPLESVPHVDNLLRFVDETTPLLVMHINEVPVSVRVSHAALLFTVKMDSDASPLVFSTTNTSSAAMAAAISCDGKAANDSTTSSTSNNDKDDKTISSAKKEVRFSSVGMVPPSATNGGRVFKAGVPSRIVTVGTDMRIEVPDFIKPGEQIICTADSENCLTFARRAHVFGH